MSTKMIARGIVGSVRLVGVTAAVAAGIAGFATISATPADAATNASAASSAVSQFKLTDQQSNVLSQFVSKLNLPNVTLKPKTCNAMDAANVHDDVLIKLGCVVIPESGAISGSILF